MIIIVFIFVSGQVSAIILKRGWRISLSCEWQERKCTTVSQLLLQGLKFISASVMEKIRLTSVGAGSGPYFVGYVASRAHPSSSKTHGAKQLPAAALCRLHQAKHPVLTSVQTYGNLHRSSFLPWWKSPVKQSCLEKSKQSDQIIIFSITIDITVVLSWIPCTEMLGGSPSLCWGLAEAFALQANLPISLIIGFFCHIYYIWHGVVERPGVHPLVFRHFHVPGPWFPDITLILCFLQWSTPTECCSNSQCVCY